MAEWGEEESEAHHVHQSHDEEHHTTNMEAGGESDETAWLTSYADMMTVLCCFFILLVSMASFDGQKFDTDMMKIAQHFVPIAQNLDGRNNIGGSPDPIVNQMKRIYSLLDDYLQISSIAQVQYNGGIDVIFSGVTMFDSGGTKPSEKVEDAINVMVEIIKSKGTSFHVLIEGHTDDSPIRGGSFPSNWELSAARATYILRKFEVAGFRAENLVAVGYGPSRPAYPNVNGLGRPIPENRRLNRRVVIKILNPKEYQQKEKMGLGLFFRQ